MSIVYIKSSEDLYHCYKYKPVIITNTVDSDYINNLNKSSPFFDDITNRLTFSCFLIRKYKGKITQYKSNNTILIVDDKLSKSALSFGDFKDIINDKLDLFDVAGYNYFITLCKKWANPYKWIQELEYLESLNQVISMKMLNLLYVNSRTDVWEYINNIGKRSNNYQLILSLDANTLWYLFIVKGVISSIKNIDAKTIAYFELLKIQVLAGKLSLKYALIYLEIYIHRQNKEND